MRLTGGPPTCLALVAALLILPTPGESQDQPSTPRIVTADRIVPAPPLAPDVITRDSQGRVTVRATQLREPLVIDGRLDEAIYTSVRPFGDFMGDVRSRRFEFEQGWTTQMVIPFKSLRYPPGRQQVLGFQVQRLDRSKNEVAHLTPIPASVGLNGIWRVSAAATLVGIEAPSGGGNFALKPYALSSVSSDRQVSPAVSNDLSTAFEFDARYKVTRVSTPILPTTPISRRWRPTTSRSTSAASACSTPRSASSP